MDLTAASGAKPVVAGHDGTTQLFWRRALDGRRNLPDMVSFNTAGRRIPLYLFPSVALGPTEYLALSKSFDSEQPWHVLIPPLRQCKAGPEGLIKEIAIHFADRLNEIQPQGRPVVVGGWSAGVTLALELARQLQARGHAVPLLIAIDMAPENTGVTEHRSSIGNQTRRIIHDSRQQGKSWLTTTIEVVRRLMSSATNGILRRRLDDVDKLQKSHPNIAPEDMVQIRRFYTAAFACPPPEPYNGKVLVIEASHELHHRVKAKWESFATDVEAVVIAGTHQSIVYWKAAAQLGEMLNFRLATLFTSR